MQRSLDNPPGTKIAKRVAKVRGVDWKTLHFHGGELTRAARHRQHRRMAFAEATRDQSFVGQVYQCEAAQRLLTNQLIDNAALTAAKGGS